MVWTQGTLEPGTVVAGYRIEAVLGRGGMGVVYRAVHERLNRAAALKVLAPMFAEDESYEARFLRESRLAASLDHPNVLPVYDAGDHDGLLYIAMKYVEGGDLRMLLQQEKTLTPERTREIVEQVAGALDAAHEAGLIHRDVKPANILVEGAHRVYLTDFGVAKPVGQTSMTRTGSFLGTVDYCPPEQINGEALDKRADVYALGCLTFHCLTGQPPYVRETEVAVIMAHLSDPIPAVTTLKPDVTRSLDGVIATAMAKHREVRYGTAGELARAFANALEQPDAAVAPPTVAATLGTAAPAPTDTTIALTEPTYGETVLHAEPDTAQVAPPPRRRRWWPIAAIAAVVLALGGVAAVVLTSGGGDSKANTSPPPAPPPPPPLPPPPPVPGPDNFTKSVAATITPVVPLQRDVNQQLDALQADDGIGAVRSAAEKLDRAVLRAQGRAGALQPASAQEQERRIDTLLTSALQAQADYVAAVEVLPAPGELTRDDATRVVDRAGRAEAAYERLAGASDGVPSMPVKRGPALHLLALVKTQPAPTTRTIRLTPLLVGPLPDDPAGEGRCFGPYKSGATLTLGGTVRHDNFLSCGDYGYPRGDPTRASGEFRFHSSQLPSRFGLTRFAANVGVDEDSSSAQAGTPVTWTLYYRGEEVCSESTVWYGGTSSPIHMDCALPGDAPGDTSDIVITQSASVASDNQFWGGVQDPTVTARG